jgi:hypothetical protein
MAESRCFCLPLRNILHLLPADSGLRKNLRMTNMECRAEIDANTVALTMNLRGGDAAMPLRIRISKFSFP